MPRKWKGRDYEWLVHNLQAHRIYQKWASIFAIIQAVGLLDAGYLLGVSPVGRCVKSDRSLTNICEEVVVVVLRVFLCPTDS